MITKHKTKCNKTATDTISTKQLVQQSGGHIIVYIFRDNILYVRETQVLAGT